MNERKLVKDGLLDKPFWLVAVCQKKGFWVSLLLLYLSFIGYMSFQVSTNKTMLFEHADKVIHFIAYVIAAGICAPMLLLNDLKNGGRSWLFFGFICCSLIGFSAFVEYMQTFVPGRDGSAADLLANALGVFLGIVITSGLIKKLGLLWVFQQ